MVIFAFFAGLFGLITGSFLNVVIHRLPREESLVWPGSHCPRCSAPIRWFHNLPLLGWVILRGRCSDCGGRIHWRYPLVELVNGLAWASLFATLDPKSALVLALFFSWNLALFFIDLEHMLLLDILTYPGMAVWLVLSVGLGRLYWFDAVAGCLLGAAIPSLLILLWKWLRGREGMGWGDAKMLAGVGAFLGWKPLLFCLLLASLLALFVGLPVALFQGRKTGSIGQVALPFGVFIAPAAFATALWGQAWIRTYLHFFGLA